MGTVRGGLLKFWVCRTTVGGLYARMDHFAVMELLPGRLRDAR